MSRASWDRRLRALEQRPSAQRPLRIVGGLPSGAGADMIKAMAGAASTARAPIMPEPADDPGPDFAPKESTKPDQAV